MKLFEIATPKLMNEGMVEPNVLLSLRNVVARGKLTTNYFEPMIMARLLQMLKNGTFYSEPNPLEVNLSTCGELIAYLKGLDAKHLTQIATELLALLQMKDADCCAKYHDPQSEYSWINWLDLFRAREATD